VDYLINIDWQLELSKSLTVIGIRNIIISDIAMTCLNFLFIFSR